MVLVLSRGGFCPKDHRQAEGLVQLHRELEPGLVTFKIYNGYWFFGRPTVEDLRQGLRAVLKKRRPDWDITKPELKAAWQQGRKDLFYPYGKTYVQTLSEQD